MPTIPVETLELVPDSLGPVKRTLDRIISRVNALRFLNRETSGNVLVQMPPIGAGNTGLFNADRAIVRTDGSQSLFGAIGLPNRTVTVRTAIQADDFGLMCDATAAAFSVFLPQANTVPGRIYAIKKVDASGNAVTVDGFSTETIDGAATSVIAAQWNGILIQCTGISWTILANI